MKIKKAFIPTITAIIIASQLAGCGAATQTEMLEMIGNQQEICIEVAVPINEEQGEEIELDWTELAYRDNYPEFRLAFDDLLGITAHGADGKNGVVYVDMEGNHTNNSTLRYAMNNAKFNEMLNSSKEDLNKAIKDVYADIEDEHLQLAILNAYFNIFNDNEPNYFNANETLGRAEFLAGVFKAENPVSDLEAGDELRSLVDATGTDETVDFVNAMLENGASYLTLEDESLNASTYNGTITRAEAIYTLVKMYYGDELAKVEDNAKVSFNDAKNGGDIATKQGFITKDGVEQKYWKSYELQYAIENPDKGIPDDLYKALVIAEKHGIITEEASRWDEGLTKSEAIEMIMNVYEDLGTDLNADRGTSEGEVINNSNGTSGQMQFEKAEEIYCQYEDIEPITVYSKVYGSVYGDPNQFEGALVVWSAYEAGAEWTFNQKTNYDGIEYYATTFTNGLTAIAPVTDFSDTLEGIDSTEEYEVEIREATPEELQDAEDTREAMKDSLVEQGYGEDYAEDFVQGAGEFIDESIMESASSASDLMDAYDDPSMWTQEELEQAQGDLY